MVRYIVFDETEENELYRGDDAMPIRGLVKERGDSLTHVYEQQRVAGSNMIIITKDVYSKGKHFLGRSRHIDLSVEVLEVLAQNLNE